MAISAQRGLCLAHSQALPHLYKLVEDENEPRLKRIQVSSVRELTESGLPGSFLYTYVYEEPCLDKIKVTVTLGTDDILATMNTAGHIAFRPFPGKSTTFIHAQLTAIIYAALEEHEQYDPKQFAGTIPLEALPAQGGPNGQHS